MSIDEETGKKQPVEEHFTIDDYFVQTEGITQDRISEEQIIREIIEDYKPHALSEPLRPKTTIEEAVTPDDIGEDDWNFDFLFDEDA